MRGKAKEICPHCKSENFVRTDSRAGLILISQIKDKTKNYEVEIKQARASIEQDDDDTKRGMLVLALIALFFIIIVNINN